MASTPKGGGAGGARRRYGAGRIAFLKHQAEVRVAVEQGQTLQAVFGEYGRKLGISYSQFARYVDKYVREAKPRSKASGRSNQVKQPAGVSAPPPSAPKPASSPARDGGASRAGGGIQQFKYSPDTGGDKDSLI